MKFGADNSHVLAASRATQLLAEFLAVVSALPDAESALAAGVEGAALALEAQVAAVVCNGRARTSTGFRADGVPHEELAEVAAGDRQLITVPTAHLVTVPTAHRLAHAIAVSVGSLDGHLVVARVGDEPFSPEEVNLARGMARVMDMTFQMLHTLDSERQLRDRSERQAAENAALLVSLRARQRLSEELSTIQRAISRRDPLADILDSVTRGVRDLLGDDIAVFRQGAPTLSTEHSASEPWLPAEYQIVSVAGGPDDLAQWFATVPMPDHLAPGRAMRPDKSVHHYTFTAGPSRVPSRVKSAPRRVRTAIAAPVHESGKVIGSLVVGSCDETREFSDHDEATLLAFAEHASLAVTDANTLEAMYRAFHDSLTGLASRALFLDRLHHGLLQAVRTRTNLTLLFIDLDHFKTVNDTLGHSAGDDLLITVAERLRHCLRASDTAARFGGDEFVVLLHATSADSATVVAGRIIDAIGAPIIVGGREVFVGASIGVAASDWGTVSADELLRNADVAMYRAKRAGRGQYALFEPQMHATLAERLQLEADLRLALDRGEMAVHYQPIVALATGEVTGVEALLRWDHPRRGPLVPADFIAVAEECGALVPIGMWVLREATLQVRRWQQHRGTPITVSVNISAGQLAQANLCTEIAEALAVSRLAPTCLILDITEALIIGDSPSTLARLRELKQLGVQLAVDDFGAGYYSPSALQRFPVDIVKIDPSFVDGIGSSSEATAFARKIVDLAHTLDLQIIAEGVQRREQFDELRLAHCELAQGYYFAEPCRTDELPALRSELHGSWQSPATAAQPAMLPAPRVSVAPLQP
ncbi:MAG TPA: EAL domain-containing protein [Acidothermaceae bacterium]